MLNTFENRIDFKIDIYIIKVLKILRFAWDTFTSETIINYFHEVLQQLSSQDDIENNMIIIEQIIIDEIGDLLQDYVQFQIF